MSLDKKNSNCKEKPLLLISPLDWGLGHTTRVVPIIQELLEQNCNVLVACNSIQKQLLFAEFPTIQFISRPGYNLKYGHSRRGTRMQLLLQIPKILTKIKRENRWLSTIIIEKQVDAVISDNRYGLSTSKIPCVLITHQLHIVSGFGTLADFFLQRFIYRYINNFNSCWVPDFPGKDGLAGKLSHPTRFPQVPIYYSGCISRLNPCPQIPSRSSIDILIILSGPEPQRTVFENILLMQLKSANQKIVFLRGLPNTDQTLQPSSEQCEYYNHVTAKQLNDLVCRSKLIICRSGYTTVMDMLKLQKKMIVVPTPGQSEQEYLAEYLYSKKYAMAMQQNNFSISHAVTMALQFDYKIPELDMNAYKSVIRDFVSQLKTAPAVTISV